MTLFEYIITNGTLYCLSLAVLLTIVILKSPRLMLQDYPKSIQKLVAPKTKKETKQTYLYGLPFMLVLFLYPLASGIYLYLYNNFTVIEISMYAGGVAFMGNLFDLLIMDWLVFCFITPKFVVVPGTENSNGYKDYKFHFIAFLKGMIFTLFVAGLTAGIVALIDHF